jgi:hypothetical protein
LQSFGLNQTFKGPDELYEYLSKVTKKKVKINNDQKLFCILFGEGNALKEYQISLLNYQKTEGFQEKFEKQ